MNLPSPPLPRTGRILFTLLAASLGLARGDVLELRNGKILNGQYLGGTATTIRFETEVGILVVQREEALALTFTTAPARAYRAPTPAAAPAPSRPSPSTAVAAPVPTTVTLPAGTLLLVRLLDGVSSKSSPGTPFATRLEYDLYLDGRLVLKSGTPIQGTVKSATQARRAVGRSTLDLRLANISTPTGLVAISTSAHQEAGEASIRQAARGAAAGAAIGAIVDGEEGAGTGAAIGATAGALKRGETISLAPGSLLDFKLQQPVTLPANP